MQWEVIVTLIIVLPVIFLPVAYIWYINFGGLVVAINRHIHSGKSATGKQHRVSDIDSELSVSHRTN